MLDNGRVAIKKVPEMFEDLVDAKRILRYENTYFIFGTTTRQSVMLGSVVISFRERNFCCSAISREIKLLLHFKHTGGHQNIVAMRDVICGSRASKSFEDCYIVLDAYE